MVPVNNLESTLTIAYKEGTSTEIALAAIANFPAAGGVVTLDDGQEWVIKVYSSTDVGNKKLQTLSNAVAVYASSGASGHTFAVGTEVWMTHAADYYISYVVGPASATDHALARFDGTTGKIVQDSGIIVNDSDEMSGAMQIDITKTALGTTPSGGLNLINTTAAAAGAQQYSPPSIWIGQGWETDATSSMAVAFRAFVRPIQGAAAPTGALDFQASINGGAYGTVLSITSAGNLEAAANWDIGAHDFRARNLTADALAANQVVFTGANGLLSVSADLAWDGSILDVEGDINIGGGTMDYTFGHRSDVLYLQSQNAATACTFEFFSKDGDGTDNVYYHIWGKGLPDALTDNEKMTMAWSNAGYYEIFTSKAGAGTLRPIKLYTTGNANQLFLDVGGNVGFGIATFGTNAVGVSSWANGTAPTTSIADSFQMWSADVGGVAAKAGPHVRTEEGGIIGLQAALGTTNLYTYQKDDLADNGTVSLPDATSGIIFVSCNAEAGMWLVQNAGECTKISGTANTADTESDTDLCVYDGGGTTAIVKNMLGVAGETRILFFFN